MSQVDKQSALNTGERLSSDASDLIIEKVLVAEIEVRSNEQLNMSLGKYSARRPPKGFAIHVDPDPEPGAIVTQITRLGADKECELILHIANYGSNVVSVEVWQI